VLHIVPLCLCCQKFSDWLAFFRLTGNVRFHACPAHRASIFRPEFGGKESVNYSTFVKPITPHSVRCFGNEKQFASAVAHKQPLSSGVVAFGFRLSQSCAAENNNIFIGEQDLDRALR
jgi:hypothetical protein